MRFFSVALLSALATSAFAEELLWERRVESLDKRQEFTPTTTTATGATCEDAFGPGYVVCREQSDTQNRLCYNPSAGQTCCSNSWACPNGAFCYINGNCCPNGLSTESCAAMISSSAKANPTTSSKPAISSAAAAKPTGGAPYPAKNGTVPSGTSGGVSKPTGVTPFTGAANSVSMEVGALALGGVVALFAMLQ